MESFEKKMLKGRGRDPQQDTPTPETPYSTLAGSLLGLGGQFSHTKSRLAAVLLSAGIAMPEVPQAYAVESIPDSISEKIINETLSTSVIEKIREQGFDIRVTLPLPENAQRPSYYIIRVGQLHEATFEGPLRLMTRGTVDKFQKRLYAVYEPLTTDCKSPVFMEGLLGGGLRTKEWAQRVNKEVQDAITSLSVIPQTVEDAVTLFATIREWDQKLSGYRRHPQAPALAGALQSAQDRVSVFIHNLPIAQKANPRIHEIEIDLKIMGISASTDILLGNSSSSFEASMRLFYEGKIDVLAAEEEEALKSAIDQFKSMRAMETRLEEITREAETDFKKTPEGEEMKSFFDKMNADTGLTKEEIAARMERYHTLERNRKEYIEARIASTQEFIQLPAMIANTNYLVHDSREKIVYDKVQSFIDAYPAYGGVGMKCAVVEYGNDHTFAESAEAWNMRQDVKVSFGIIEIYDQTVEKKSK